MTRHRTSYTAVRFVLFLGAAFALATVCRQGVPLTVVGMVLAAYVAAASWWVLGQHIASVDAWRKDDPTLRPRAPNPWLSLAFLLLGAAGFAYGAARDNGTTLIGGTVLAYLSAGYLLARARLYTTAAGERRCTRAAVSVLTVVAVAAFVGLLLLERDGRYAFLAGALVFAPIGLSLLAEPEIRKLQGVPGDRRLARRAGIGGALLVLAIVVAYIRVDTAWIVYAFLGLSLLVLAIVSSTQADIAVVIALVALMGLTPGSKEKPDALEPESGDPNVLVALGDSYMSGEGEEVYYEEEGDEDHENHCHRAPTAWAVEAVTEKRLFERVAFLACSGALTNNVRHAEPLLPNPAPTPQYNETDTQLDRVHALGLEPSLVVVSLGGNDAGFATIGMMCMAPGDCSDKEELWIDNLPRVAGALSVAYGQIRKEFPRAPVLVVGYPAPIYAGKGRSCDDVALSKKDIGFVTKFVRLLNDTVEETATSKKGFHFLDMEPALADEHRQLCDPENDGEPGLNFIGLRSVGGFPEQRFNPSNWYHNSLHPNELGHDAMLKAFERWHASHNPPAGGKAPTTTAPPEPQCDLWEEEPSKEAGEPSAKPDCDDEAATWVRGRVRDMMLFWGLWGLQIGLATAGAWLLAVAYFSWPKPWKGLRERIGA